jgi:hypothetical protein
MINRLTFGDEDVIGGSLAETLEERFSKGDQEHSELCAGFRESPEN